MDEDLSPLKTQRARSLNVHNDPLISLSGPSGVLAPSSPNQPLCFPLYPPPLFSSHLPGKQQLRPSAPLSVSVFSPLAIKSH